MNFGYFGEVFSGILVYHYPPWPTLSKGRADGSIHELGTITFFSFDYVIKEMVNVAAVQP